MKSNGNVYETIVNMIGFLTDFHDPDHTTHFYFVFSWEKKKERDWTCDH